MSRVIWLPPSHAIHNTEPAAWCTLCGKPFYPNDMGPRGAYERHVVSGHSEEEILVHSPQHQAPGLFGTAGGDEDWTKWVEDHRKSDPHGWARWGRTDDGKHSSGIGDG